MNDKNVVFGVVCNEESMAVLFEVRMFLYSVCFIYKISKRPNPLVRALQKKQVERQGSVAGKPKNAVYISDCGQLYP